MVSFVCSLHPLVASSRLGRPDQGLQLYKRPVSGAQEKKLTSHSWAQSFLHPLIHSFMDSLILSLTQQMPSTHSVPSTTLGSGHSSEHNRLKTLPAWSWHSMARAFTWHLRQQTFIIRRQALTTISTVFSLASQCSVCASFYLGQVLLAFH